MLDEYIQKIFEQKDKSAKHKNSYIHIFFSAVNLACDRKFRDFLGSGRALGRLSDTLCVENGLSIIEKPQHTTLTYDK